MSLSRIRLAALHDKVMSAEQAASFIKNDMTVGMSGFTRAGEAKAVPQALVEQAKKNPLKITLITGASLGAKGQMLVIVEDKTGQQLWQLDASGKIQRKTRIAPQR